jgi:uncharacterized membrane protein
MDNLQMKALLAGLFFGIWPLFMNKSGLNGNVSSVVFAGIACVCLIPLSIGAWGNIGNTKWVMVIAAGILGAIGLICFNGMLAKATAQNVSTLFVLMIVMQTAVPILYQVMMNGGMSLTKGIGFALAAIATVLLLKG